MSCLPESIEPLIPFPDIAMHRSIALLGTGLLGFAAAVDLNVSALVAETIESDWTTTYYSDDSPLLIGNDGGASTGGFHVWNIDGDAPLNAVETVFTGRTKLVSTLYNVAGRDYLASISQTTSRLSLYELPDVSKVDGTEYFALGDWAALCSWKSQSKNDYLFLFGKREAIQFLVRNNEDSDLELLRVSIVARLSRSLLMGVGSNIRSSLRVRRLRSVPCRFKAVSHSG